MKENEVRAVEMVREIRDQIYEETKRFSPEELRDFIARESHREPPNPSKRT